MVSRRIVEIDSALDQPHAEHAGVEVEILLRIACDCGDVMNTGRDQHQDFITDGRGLLLVARLSFVGTRTGMPTLATITALVLS